MTKKSEELDKLWNLHHAAYLQGNGDNYKNQLIELSLFYIEIIADKIHSGRPYIELEDLKQEGVFGAIEAVKSFNPRKARFVTYLDRKVRSKILDYLRREDWVPRVIRPRVANLKKATQRLESISEYKPTREQLIKELSKKEYKDSSKDLNQKLDSRKKAQYIFNDAANLNKIISLFETDEDDKEDSERHNHLINYIKNKKALEPTCKSQKKDFKDFLYGGLTRKERLVLNLYYFTFYTQEKGKLGIRNLGMTQPEIAKFLELGATGVHQIRSRALLKIKERLTRKGLNLEACLNSL